MGLGTDDAAHTRGGFVPLAAAKSISGAIAMM
jgi:hypothetical protein